MLLDGNIWCVPINAFRVAYYVQVKIKKIMVKKIPSVTNLMCNKM